MSNPSEHDMSNPSEHEQPEPLAHYVTIKAVLPLVPTDPAAWDLDALLEHLSYHPEQIEEVTTLRLVPDPDPTAAQPKSWRSPITGLSEVEDGPPTIEVP